MRQKPKWMAHIYHFCSQPVFVLALHFIANLIHMFGHFWSEPTVLIFSRILWACLLCLDLHFELVAYGRWFPKRFIGDVHDLGRYLIVYLYLRRLFVKLIYFIFGKTNFETVKFLRIRWILFKLDGEAAAFFEKVQLVSHLLFTVRSSELVLEKGRLAFLFALRSFGRANLFENAQSLHHL